MDRTTDERHALLVRQVRGPLDPWVELIRSVESAHVAPEPGLQSALLQLARELGIERLAIERAARDGECTTDARAELAVDALQEARIPIVRRQTQVGILRAWLPQADAGAQAERLCALSLAAALLADIASEHADTDRSSGVQPPTQAPVRPALLGASAAVLGVRRCVQQVAASDLTVLIEGESGTGKESIARAIHEQSPRASGPFVVLSGASSAEWLAQWMATATSAGVARNATLFVDELAELSPPMQAELLHALRSAQRAEGDSSAGERAVRVIAATRADLAEAVADGRFRKDLYYRVREFPIALLPLRMRKSDLPLLAAHFLTKHAAVHRKSVTRISDPALELLLSYDWPGNARELENCISRAVLLAHYGVVRQHHLPPALQPRSLPADPPRALRARVERFERELIARSLERSGGKRAAAAQLLGTTARVLAYRMQRLGL